MKLLFFWWKQHNSLFVCRKHTKTCTTENVCFCKQISRPKNHHQAALLSSSSKLYKYSDSSNSVMIIEPSFKHPALTSVFQTFIHFVFTCLISFKLKDYLLCYVHVKNNTSPVHLNAMSNAIGTKTVSVPAAIRQRAIAVTARKSVVRQQRSSEKQKGLYVE